MSSKFHRRDFLKLAGALPMGYAASHMTQSLGLPPLLQGGQKNVLVIVFDAFSAYNIPLYGYGRETTPNLARLAEHAIVYHNHFSASNFTGQRFRCSRTPGSSPASSASKSTFTTSTKSMTGI